MGLLDRQFALGYLNDFRRFAGLPTKDGAIWKKSQGDENKGI
jgi:hypothetical protein